LEWKKMKGGSQAEVFSSISASNGFWAMSCVMSTLAMLALTVVAAGIAYASY
jgi:hypothetical protein